MHRSWLQRACAVLFATWFAFVGLEPGALGACPMHGSNAGHASRPAAHSTAHTSAHQHGAPAPAHEHHCLCPDGCCCAAVALELPAPAPRAARLAIFEPPRPVLPRATASVWRDFVLPFPTAPPAFLAT